MSSYCENKTYFVADRVGVLVLLLIVVLFHPVIFNLIPYSIHQMLTPDGAGEWVFIVLFDLVAGVIFCYVLYKIVLKLLS